jgi:hypothetical protein
LRGGIHVFNREDFELLNELFTSDFEAFTRIPEASHPLIRGTWINPKTREVFDEYHRGYEVITLFAPKAVTYFEELKGNLESYSRTAVAKRLQVSFPGYQGEQQIFIQMEEVTIIGNLPGSP